MKCSDFEELLSAYANDELPRTQREFIERHLSGCDNCRELLAEYVAVRQNVSRLRDLSPLSDFSQDIMLRIKENKNSSKTNNVNGKGNNYWGFYKKRWLSASLAFVLILSLFLSWFFVSDNA
ncbi:MAG: anti-sigma factor family protein, partial [Peptococcaceae bacterium]